MMGKLIKNIRGYIQPAVFYIPFTFYFFLFAVAAIVAGNWLSVREIIPESSFADIFKLLLKTGIWFLVAVIGIAMLSVLLSFGIFLWKKRKNTIRFYIQSATPGIQKNDKPVQKIHISVTPVLKPFLGFIKLRLQYDHDKFSDKFVLAEAAQQKLIPATFAGDYVWNLPEIKEYQVEKIIVYFEDLFQFFSLTVALPVQNRFHTHPFAPPVQPFSITPQKTEDTSSRIEELKKVEGEYLNYKNFENNDDVRRIVWKIYARNKELVVRIPEVLDPYASHANMYVSFYNSTGITGNAVAEKFFLNYYKSMAWAIYQQTVAQGFQVRYMADQVTPTLNTTDESLAVQYTITTSNWQQEKDLKNVNGIKDASVIVVSSLSNPEDVSGILESKTGSTVIVFVKLSRSLQQPYMMSLLKWLFIQQEKNEVEVYKTNWRLSLLRPKILQNEKKLEALVKNYSRTIIL